MYLRIIQSILCYLACVIAFEDLIYVYGQESLQMQEQGRSQYQLLQERSNLPHYGTCWKDAIKHVDESCRNLSEETQAEIALHLANCFLAMSGHVTYECELDKKPNLRGICINSMSDRAFNVYTEFYTHTQNICWFLRGQLWHETISENTWKVGKQLQDSAKNQELIIKTQLESLEIQEKLLEYGNALEKTMEKFYESSKNHQEILTLFSTSINNLQSWLLGEITWFDTLIFYIFASLFILLFTSVPRTSNARLIMLSILTVNACIERLLCYLLSRNFGHDIRDIQVDYYTYVWYLRYTIMCINLGVLILTAVSYRNTVSLNTKMLNNIYDAIISVSKKMDFVDSKANGDISTNNVSYVSECSETPENNIKKYLNSIKSNIHKENHNDLHIVNTNENHSIGKDKFSTNMYNRYSGVLKENVSIRDIGGRKRVNPLGELEINNKYYLRSQGVTPEINM